jgi:hypothetical protein
MAEDDLSAKFNAAMDNDFGGRANDNPPVHIVNARAGGAAQPRSRPPGGTTAGGVTTVHIVAVFGRANHRTLEEIVLGEVIVRKGDRGSSGLKIFVANP